jgi:hypothetical protein
MRNAASREAARERHLWMLYGMIRQGMRSGELRSGEASRGIAGRASEIHRQSVCRWRGRLWTLIPANEPRNPRPFAAGNNSRRLLNRNRKCSVPAMSCGIHYTPKNGSWLNMAEIELGILGRQYLDCRIPDRNKLTDEVAAWQRSRNQSRSKVDWQFTADDARIKLKRLYPIAETNDSQTSPRNLKWPDH